MLLIGIARKAQLKRRLMDLQFKEMKLQDRIQELASYAANIADGIITPQEMATSSHSIFGKQMMYMMQNIPMAMMQGQMAFNMYMGQYGPQMMAFGQDPTMGMMMQTNPMLLQMNFFKQALERQGKIEQEKIHVEEKQLQSEKARLDTQIKMIEAELQSLDKAVDHEIQQSAPTYGFRGRG